jgi:hypothetical protein
VIPPHINLKVMMRIVILRNPKYIKRGKKYSQIRVKMRRVKMAVMGVEGHHLLYLLLHLIKMERVRVQIAKKKLIDSQMAKKRQIHQVQRLLQLKQIDPSIFK